jgi:hypothetical protein
MQTVWSERARVIKANGEVEYGIVSGFQHRPKRFLASKTLTS